MRELTVDDPALRAMPALDAPGSTPSYRRIEQWVLALISAGDVVPGDKLPPEAGMAAALGVSRMTLRQALAALEGRQVLKRRRGRNGGTFVVEPKIESDLTGLPGFTEQMRRANVRAGARVVRVRRLEAGRAVASALELTQRTEVFEIIRVRSARREPLALEETYLPCHLFPRLDERRLTGSIYAIMRHDYDLAPHHAQEWLEPALASAEHASLLDIEPGAPLMLVTRTSYTVAGVAVEHAYDRYRADRTRISLRTSVSTTVSAELVAETGAT